jgi:hypothetical protein
MGVILLATGLFSTHQEKTLPGSVPHFFVRSKTILTLLVKTIKRINLLALMERIDAIPFMKVNPFFPFSKGFLDSALHDSVRHVYTSCFPYIFTRSRQEGSYRNFICS